MSFDFLRNSFKGNDQERMRRKKSTPLHFSLLLVSFTYNFFVCVFIEKESFFPKIRHSSLFPAHNYRSCSLQSFCVLRRSVLVLCPSFCLDHLLCPFIFGAAVIGLLPPLLETCKEVWRGDHRFSDALCPLNLLIPQQGQDKLEHLR